MALNEDFSAEETAVLTREPVEAPKQEPKAEPEPKGEPEAKPEAKAEPEPKADDKPAEAKERKPPKNPDAKVPIAALHEARKLADEWKAKFEAAQKAQTEQKPVEIDPDQDPVAALKQERELRQQKEAAEQQQREQQEFNSRFVNAYASAAREYAKEQTDFPDAYKHLYQTRVDQLEAIGYDHASAVKLAENEERNIVWKAMNDGVNPAERLYALSQKMGYAKAAPKEEPKPEAKAEPDPEATAKLMGKLDTIEKGVKAASSLSSAPGGAEPPPSLKSILDMDEEDLAKMDKKAFRKAMGG